MPTTGKDIARKLGLSQPTVSRVLSGSNRQVIADETRLRVENAAREMGYRPNTLARSLRTRRTDTIGFYASVCLLREGCRNTAEFWISMKRACDSYGLDLLVHTNKQGDTPETVFEQIVGGRTDGALLCVAPDSPLLRYIEQSSFPIISLGPSLRRSAAGVDHMDDRGAELEDEWSAIAEQAVEGLVEKIDRLRAARFA